MGGKGIVLRVWKASKLKMKQKGLSALFHFSFMTTNIEDALELQKAVIDKDWIKYKLYLVSQNASHKLCMLLKNVDNE